MAGPAIPYLELPEIPLSFLQHLPLVGASIDPASPPTIKPFGTLVAMGVYLGSVLAVRHARDRGLDTKKLNDFIFYCVGCGFVGAHVLDAIFYYPDKVAQNPLFLLELWAGLSSFGGFIGGAFGVALWKWRHRSPVLAQADMLCSAFPLAWVFGRAGCSVAHDHPGRMTDSWLGVQYPHLPPGIGRFDLGLIECVLTIPLAIAFAILWNRKPRFFGFYVGWMSVLYAPVRFGLDFLRVGPGDKLPADERYFSLTPAQWASFGLLAFGLYILREGKRQAGVVPATYEEARAIAAREAEADAEVEPSARPARPARAATPQGPAARRKAAAAAAVDAALSGESPDGSDDPSASEDPAKEAAGETPGASATAATPRPRHRRRPKPAEETS